MFQRLAVAFLWFVSFLALHEIAWSLFGSPRVLGVVIGGAAAAFFYFDPSRLFTVASLPQQETKIDRRVTPTDRIPVTR